MGAVTRLASVALFLTLAFAPGTSRAQDPALRVDLERFQQDVAAMSDTGDLRRLEHRFSGKGATTEVEAIRRMRRGFVRLRLGVLGDGWSLGRAAADFERATTIAAAWPLAWQGLGHARQLEAAWIAADLRNLGHRLGETQRRAAVRAYWQATGLEPGSIPALTGLVAAGGALRDTSVLIGAVLPRLRRAASTEADTAIALLAARARLEREFGSPDSAVDVAHRFARLSQRPGLARLELARSLFARGDEAGTAPYFDGGADDDTTSVAAYRRDLAYIADATILAAFDSASGVERVAVLRRFWRGLDWRDLRVDGEWLTEHYQRLAYARRHFALRTNRPRYHVRDGFDSGSTEFDDRGIVYLRHGEPDRVAGRAAIWSRPGGGGRELPASAADLTAGVAFDSLADPATAGTGRETWLYFQGDSLYLVEFAAGAVTIQNAGDPDDYRLIPYLSTLPGGDDPDIQERVEAIRPELLAYFTKAWGWGPYGQALAASAFRRTARAGIARATTALSHEPRFRRRLPVTVQVAVVGREADSGLAHIIYAIPRAASDSTGTDTVILPVRLRLMAVDASGATQSVDTTDQLQVGPPLARNDWILGRFTVRLSPGSWRYRVALEAANEFGRVLPPDSLAVPGVAGPLAVSDPALGQAGRGVPWIAAAGDTAWFQTGRPLGRALPLDLYFEVYGLAPGEPFQTTLTVRAGKRTRLAISSEERATGPVTRIHRTAALARLSPGRYSLQIAVTAGGGAAESRPVPIEVIGE